MQWLTDMFDKAGLAPHGSCLLWRPELYWTHAISDIAIALSYFSIPAFLAVLMLRRPDLIPRPIVGLFICFIVACGITHLLGFWTLWVPDYGPEAMAKVATAIVSLITATILWPHLPRVLAAPSFTVLEARNAALEVQTRERAAAEEELRQLNRQLERRVAERTADLNRARLDAELANRTKTAFLAAMSHELRTPMNAILGFTEMLKMPGLVTAEATRSDYLNHVEDSARHLNTLIGDVLDVARVESGRLDFHMDRIDLDDALSGPRARAAEAAERAGLVFFDAADSRGETVHADGVRVAQVLDNLLSNAIKYNRPGGSVRLSLDRSRPGWIGLAISDTGIGIPEDKHDRLFVAFDRLDREAGPQAGTGLGLVLVRDLLTAMNGTISVESRDGEGSTFTAWLPLTERSGPPVGRDGTGPTFPPR